jgi:predicted dehydrogenase
MTVLRRECLKGILASSVAISLLKNAGIASPLKSPLFPPRIVPNGEKVRIAVVGIANRGKAHMDEYMKDKNVDIVALCDVDSDSTKDYGETIKGIPFFADYREMLKKMHGEIDAVSVCTPDFSHFNVAMSAMYYGKHVYVEKPLTHTVLEVRIIAEAAKQFGVVTQMGNQGQSGVGMLNFNEWVRAGVLPFPKKITAWMNQNRRWHSWGKVKDFPKNEACPDTLNWDLWLNKAHHHDYSERFHPGDWRDWFDFGCGALGDWGAHILDGVYMNYDLGLPYEIHSTLTQKSDTIFPMKSHITYYFKRPDSDEPFVMEWFDGKGNSPKHLREKYSELEFESAGHLIEYDDFAVKGTSHGKGMTMLPKATFLEMRKKLPLYKGRPSGHFANFILACQNKEQARSPFDKAAKLTEVLLLGVIAQRYEGVLKYDTDAMKITNNPAADAMLKNYAPRQGWNEHYQL